MENVNFTVKECDKKKHDEVCIALVLENNGDKDFYLTSDVLFLDGFTASHKFKISGYPEVICRIPDVKYRPKVFVLGAGEVVISELMLSDVCSFSPGGKHTVSFRSHAIFCEDKERDVCADSEMLIGEVDIELLVTHAELL